MADDDPTTPVNPFAPPLGTALAEPVALEFETPSLASLNQSAPPDVWRLLELAEHGISDDERRSAVETLVTIFQQHVSEFRRKQRQQIDLPLVRFFERQSLRAIADANPSKAAQFLVPLKRGRRASSDIAASHLRVAGEVGELMESGSTYENAIAEIADRWGLSSRQVGKIYAARQWEWRVSRHERI
jgi:hypothetical protein